MAASGEPPKTYRVKIVIVGEPCVGKTAIISVLTNDASHFPKNYNLTAGIELRTKLLQIPNSIHSVEFLLIDSAGHYMFENFMKKAWPQNCLLCLVYDMTNKASFEKLNAWIEIARVAAAQGPPGLLLANKADLANRRFVTTSMGKDFAQKHRLLYFECSAKENVDLHEAFRTLAAEWNKRPKL